MELRPYQTEAVEKIESFSRPLLAAPTGSGKTVIAAEVIRRAPDSHVLFFAHRRELVTQAVARLEAVGIQAGMILAEKPTNHMARVQVASIQTLTARCIRGEQDLPPAKLVIVDEAHHAPSATYRALLARYPDSKIFGMTATPCRKDGRGLGGLFEALVETPQIPELIKLGYLVGTVTYAPSVPDLKGVRTRAGDYVESQLAERMDRPELVGDIVSTWLRLGERRKTVAFATSVNHSVHLAYEFNKAGVRAAHLDGSTPAAERDEILARLASGDLELVSNCAVLLEGWDSPSVSCCILARPTKSFGLYRQMLGRVLRPAEGKENALILDHAGAVYAHGFAEDEVCWSLDPDTKATNPTHAARGTAATRKLVECVKCHAVRTAGLPCGHCGYFPRRPGEFVITRDGELAHLTRDGELHASQYSPSEKVAFYRGLLHLAAERGNKPGAAAYRFKDKFGDWPPRRWSEYGPAEPTPEVIAWDRHCRIRFAKSMQKAQAVNA